MRAHTVKHITKICEGVNLTQLAAGDRAIDDSGPFGTGVAPGEESVLASNGYNPELSKDFEKLLALWHRLLVQRRHDHNKLYSIHAPEVVCISKGKSHPRYEFGCKVRVVTTMKAPFIVGIQAFEGNPFDGHTLESSVEQAERLGSFKVEDIYTDPGYRGHNCEGDKINAILCGCGYNIRRLLRAFICWLSKYCLWSGSMFRLSCRLLVEINCDRLFQGRLYTF